MSQSLGTRREARALRSPDGGVEPAAPAFVLPWHLRKRFVLPVAAVLLLAALVTLSGVIIAAVLVLTTAGALASLLGQAPAVEPLGEIAYEVETTADSVQVDWQATADGQVESVPRDAGPSTFRPENSEGWDTYSVTVTSTDAGRGEVSCRIVDAVGQVLAESSGSEPGASATCSWERGQ